MLFFQTLFSSGLEKIMYYGFQKIWAATSDWRNGCWKISFAITEITILKYIKIVENRSLKLLQYFTILQFIFIFYPINATLVSKRDFKNIKKSYRPQIFEW